LLLDKEENIHDQEDQEELDQEELLYFLVIFLIIGYGALVRAILMATGLPVSFGNLIT
jgi:hypothetical protein